MLRSIVPLVVGVLFCGLAVGQSMEEKYQKKLENPFVSKIKWVQDYDKALVLSKEQGKPIFGYFTRSYAP